MDSKTVFFINRCRTAENFMKPYVDWGTIVSKTAHGFTIRNPITHDVAIAEDVFERRDDANAKLQEILSGGYT